MPKDHLHDKKLESLRAQGTLNPHPQDVSHPVFQDNEFFDARDLVQVKYEMLRQVRVEKAPRKRSASLARLCIRLSWPSNGKGYRDWCRTRGGRSRPTN
jgi:hypothetical protein